MSPNRKLRWCDKPKVIVCEDEVAMDQIYVELAFGMVDLTLLGSLEIEYKECTDECAAYADTIIISKPTCFTDRQDGMTYGMTRAHQRETSGCIHWARVELWEQDPRVLTHEAGHAVGYEHTKKEGHLMHPLYSYGGWDREGM